MLERLNRLKEQHNKNRETFNYKLEYSVLELTESILKRMEEIGIDRPSSHAAWTYQNPLLQECSMETQASLISVCWR